MGSKAPTKKEDASINNLIQRKTIVENRGQECVFVPKDGLEKATVGSTMDAWLDPANPLRGQSANVNTSQVPLMKWIKGIYPMAKGGLSVRGHRS
ncbi:MAG: hypothetical protein HRT57_17430 [Crocinitomicaceae bacterium]|nr:hypothetical protein [Crocinitomicaceae bacterium]